MARAAYDDIRRILADANNHDKLTDRAFIEIVTLLTKMRVSVWEPRAPLVYCGSPPECEPPEREPLTDDSDDARSEADTLYEMYQKHFAEL